MKDLKYLSDFQSDKGQDNKWANNTIGTPVVCEKGNGFGSMFSSYVTSGNNSVNAPMQGYTDRESQSNITQSLKRSKVLKTSKLQNFNVT